MEIGGDGPGPHLLYRESFDPALLRAGALSLGVHFLVALAIVAWSLIDLGGKDRTPPVYTVALVSPKPGSSAYSVGPLAAKPAPKPAPKPKAPAKPAPKPKPVAKAPPKPVPKPKPVVKAVPKPKTVEKTPPKPVAKAGPAVKTSPKPAPPASASSGKAKPSASIATSGSRSGRTGSAGGQAKPLAYVRYFNELHDALKSHFVWAGAGKEDLAATVRFSILPDGRITDVRMKTGSGDPRYDRAVLSAVLGVVQLSPPPPQHRDEFKDVEWVFRPTGS